MRLLRLKDGGDFSLVEYVGNHIPPYAILSHTWGANHEEVTFKDLTEGTGKNKTGYRKLTFCREQAANDGLQFFWVDTCCIDKSSSAELSEAINSMYKWYMDASECYAYLIDVSASSFPESFGASRWFTRGWTLQELIAPRNIGFFSVEWVTIGTKTSLSDEIANITGIPISVLRGEDHMKCNIAEKMSWASKRRTTKPEDMAYSLFGLFNVNMPLLYGEGGPKAFIRLQREIMMTLEEDHTLFAWRSHRAEAEGLLTTSPADFCLRDCRTCLQERRYEYSNLLATFTVTGRPNNPPALTSHGLHINLALENQMVSTLSPPREVLALLNLSVYYPEEPERGEMLSVLLEPHQYMPAKFFRKNSRIELVNLSSSSELRIYVHQERPKLRYSTLSPHGSELPTFQGPELRNQPGVDVPEAGVVKGGGRA